MTEPFDQLSLKEILELITAWGESNQPGSQLLRLHRRLMDIAFMEHGISEAESAAAAELAGNIEGLYLARVLRSCDRVRKKQ